MRLLLTPIVLIVFGIGLLALLATYRRERSTARAAWLLFGIAYLSSTSAPVGIALRAWQVKEPPECRQPFPSRTYVVLTGGASGAARRSSDVALLHLPTFRRLIYAVDMAALSPDGYLLISGGAEVGLVNEAQIAREFVLRLGWAADHVAIEERSFDTYSSAYEVASILKRDSIAQPVMLVTSAMHMRRARFAYRQAGVSVLACPTDYVELFPMFPDSFIPEVRALQMAGEAWKEAAGLAVYAMRAAISRRST